ncbi:MAG: hypothetical protein HDS35_03865 [Bacteroides sp.]|nr:hypothetical protein [Bacteroides sp.]
MGYRALTVNPDVHAVNEQHQITALQPTFKPLVDLCPDTLHHALMLDFE